MKRKTRADLKAEGLYQVCCHIRDLEYERNPEWIRFKEGICIGILNTMLNARLIDDGDWADYMQTVSDAAVRALYGIDEDCV